MTERKKNIEKFFYSIGEVAELVSVTPSSIRYWESNFDELAPRKSAKGTRLFSKEDIEVVRFINYLVKECGMTIKGVQQKLKDNKRQAVGTWEIVKRLQFVKNELLAIRDELDGE